MSHYVPVLDTPEMQRVRENQKNFSTVSVSPWALSQSILCSYCIHLGLNVVLVFFIVFGPCLSCVCL